MSTQYTRTPFSKLPLSTEETETLPASTSNSSLHSPPTDTICTSSTVPLRSAMALCQSSIGESLSITKRAFDISCGNRRHTSGVQSAMSTVLAPCSSRRAGSRNNIVCCGIVARLSSASAQTTLALLIPSRGRLPLTTSHRDELRST